MRDAILIMLLLFSGFPDARSQGITGTWSGQLTIPGGGLTLVWHIKDSSGVLTGQMDSPDQGVTGIAVSSISFDDPDLRIEVADLMIDYKATLLPGDSLRGIFKQAGRSVPMTLHRGISKGNTLVRPQEPHPPFPYKSEDIEFVNAAAGNIKLSGTLTLPESGNSFPAVVLITGSGPQDRDESLVGHKPFLVISDYLTKRGIVVLRFDDRGTARSTGNFAAATTADFATDAEAAVRYLKSRRDINSEKIGLVGHSEGGLIAPMVAAEDKSIAFIVLLAGPGYDGKEILLMQNEAIAKASGATEVQLNEAYNVNNEIYNVIIDGKDDAAIKAALTQKLESLTPPGMSEDQKKQRAAAQVSQVMSPWFRYFLKVNPPDYLKKVRCPVLAVGGSKDLQVPATRNIAAINKALQEGGNGDVTTKIFPGLNHLFQHAVTGLPNEYQQIEETFSPEVLGFIGDWIGKTLK